MADNHPAITLWNEPAFQTLISSEQYNNLTPEKRRGVLQALGGMTPEERQQVAGGLNRDPRLPSPANETMLQGMSGDTPDIDVLSNEQKMARGKTTLATGIALGASIGLPALLPAAGIGSGILATTSAAILGNVGGRKVNQALGLEEGSPLSWDKWDTVNAAVPAAVGAGQAATRFFTKPGVAALKAADTVNEASQAKYGTNVKETLHAVGEADQTAVDQRAANLKAWEQQKAENIHNSNAQMSRATDRANLSNERNSTNYARDTEAYQTTTQQHAIAAAKLKAAPDTLTTEDFKELYKAVPKDAAVPLTNSKAAAQKVIDTIDNQFPGFKDSALYKKARGILDYGKPQAAEGVDPAIEAQMRNRGQLPEQAPTTAANPKFDEAQQLLSDVGALKRSAEATDGRMRGLIKQLDKGVFQDIEATGEPGSALSAANKAYSRSRSKDDLIDIFTGGVRERTTDNAIQVNGRSIRDGFEKWLADPFTAKNFSGTELKNITETVRDITTLQPLRKTPGTAPVPTEPDYSRVTTKLPGPQPEPVQPNYKGIDYPEPVSPVDPKITVPVAKAIGARVIGGTVAGAAAGAYGGDQRSAAYWGIGGAVTAFAGPQAISYLLIHGPKGQAFLRGVMAGEHILSPERVAILVRGARAMGMQGEATK